MPYSKPLNFELGTSNLSESLTSSPVTEKALFIENENDVLLFSYISVYFLKSYELVSVLVSLIKGISKLKITRPNGSKIIAKEIWGLKKLAYTIQNKNSGFLVNLSTHYQLI